MCMWPRRSALRCTGTSLGHEFDELEGLGRTGSEFTKLHVDAVVLVPMSLAQERRLLAKTRPNLRIETVVRTGI